MGFEQRKLRLEDFNHTPDQKGRELLKLTFENGNVLFLSGEGSFTRGYHMVHYKVHPDFIPSQLQKATERLRFDPRDEAFVGHADVGFTVPIYIGDSNGQEGECRTVSRLISIEPCNYRDAYHDNLQLDQQY